MSIIDRVSLTLVAATGAIIGGIIQITKNADELIHLPSQMKSKAKTKNRKQKSRKILFQFSKIKRESKSNFPRKLSLSNLQSKRLHRMAPYHQSRSCEKDKQLDLITNPGNVVELCKPCHDQTTASKSGTVAEEGKCSKSKFWHHTPANKRR